MAGRFGRIPVDDHGARLRGVSKGAQLVYFHLCARCQNDKMLAHPGIEKLAVGTTYTRRSVQLFLRELESTGWIVRTGQTKAGAVMYHLPTSPEPTLPFPEKGAPNGGGGAQPIAPLTRGGGNRRSERRLRAIPLAFAQRTSS